MIIARTPFRISFFGGGTDFPAFFRRHGGAVLGCTIDKYCYLSVHRLAAFSTHRFRAAYSRTEQVDAPAAFQHPLIRETLLLLDQRDGVDIAHVADLPAQTGLGTSSAFTVGLLHALHTYRDEPSSPEQLAREAICIERDRVGDAGGWQDQVFAAHGGFRRIDFATDGAVDVKDVCLPATRQHDLERRLMLFYMDSACSAEALLREQSDRMAINQPALLDMRQMVRQAEAVLTGRGSLTDFGRLLHAAWQRKRTLARGISHPMIDQAYAAARAAGAIGGKLLGAGGRGFLCLFVDPRYQMAVREALGANNEVAFRFTSEGSRIIFASDE